MIKIPLVGAAYQMQAKSIDTQNCINWYPQAIEYPNGTRVKALMPTAGLKKIFQGDNAAVRALFVLSNGNLLAVIGKKLYHTAAKVFNLQYVGEISGLSQVSIADNGLVAMLVNGTYTYSLDLTTLTLTKLTGSNIPRSTSVAFLDGRFILNKIGTGRFVWTALYSTDIDPLSFATAEASPDPITAIVVFNRELWMFGSQTVERYYSTGTNDLPYARLSGGTMPFGCVTPNSISRFTGGFIWLAVSEFGGNQIVVSDGGSPSRVSTHAIEEDIGTYARTDDAVAYAYQFEGHVFYVISFPTANVTWCYDAGTGLWHERSWTNEQGFHERHRSQCHAFFRNMHIVGDHRNGKLYALDKNTYTDDGDLITRERTCPAVITDGAHVRYNQLEIVCETGGERRDYLNPIQAALDGLRWDFPLIDASGHVVPDVHVETIMTGDSSKTYRVKVRIYGLVETPAYNGFATSLSKSNVDPYVSPYSFFVETRRGETLTHTPSTANNYSLTISNPSQKFYLNNKLTGTEPLFIDGELTFIIKGDAIVALDANSNDGISSGSQWLQMDVISVQDEAFVRNDPYFDMVTSLLLLNGANDSTTILDYAPLPQSWVRNGEAKIKVVDGMVGGSCLALDGVGDYISVSGSASHDLSGVDFTVEAFVQLTSIANDLYLFSFRVANNHRWALQVFNTGIIRLYTENSGAGALYVTSNTVMVGQRTHIALTKTAGVTRIFIDGVMGYSGLSPTFPAGITEVRIGTAQPLSPNPDLNGFIDMVRITKGVSRYVENFAPSTIEFKHW